MSDHPAVAELVPHSAPMLLLDELISADTGRATARVTIRDDMPFVREGQVDAVVTLEYMAQTVAACLGREALREGGRVRIGMLVACRSMTIYRPTLRVGEVLHCDVVRVTGTADLSQFEALTRNADGALVAELMMTLVHAERPPD